MRHSGKAVLRLMLPQRGAKANNSFSCLLPEMGVSLPLKWGDGRGGGVAYLVCPPPQWCCVRDHAQDPAFAPQTPEVAVGFLVFLYLGIHNGPQLHMRAVIFSPL